MALAFVTAFDSSLADCKQRHTNFHHYYENQHIQEAEIRKLARMGDDELTDLELGEEACELSYQAVDCINLLCA